MLLTKKIKIFVSLGLGASVPASNLTLSLSGAQLRAFGCCGSDVLHTDARSLVTRGQKYNRYKPIQIIILTTRFSCSKLVFVFAKPFTDSSVDLKFYCTETYPQEGVVSTV